MAEGSVNVSTEMRVSHSRVISDVATDTAGFCRHSNTQPSLACGWLSSPTNRQAEQSQSHSLKHRRRT